MERVKSLNRNIMARVIEIENVVKINALARKCHLHVDTISEILKGNTKDPGVYTIAKIANVFNCSIDELIYDNEDDDENVKLKTYLARRCLTVTVDLLCKKNRSIDLDDFLFLLDGIYLHSLDGKVKDIDINFAETYVNNFFKK